MTKLIKSLNDVRSAFLDYFIKNGHLEVSSSSLVPDNDNSLLFTNSGMVQFKDVFLGKQKPATPRITSAQKCIRAGCKHNDLENVGYTSRHHTFFEMLGNFSFNDYFKEQAIFYAWDFLTNVLCIDKNRLYVTIYHSDDEAFELWQKIAMLKSERIIRIKTQDNFWSMGETGPCGPCSEIFFDHGDKMFGGLPGTPDEDGERFVEVWNLVFMQYSQSEPNGKITPLDSPCVDTGAGLERLSAVTQGVSSNYDIDLFQGLIEEIVSKTGKAYHTGASGSSHRVIADHIRAITFLLADGVIPASYGRGYVLRRIIRRAARHVHLLNCRDLLLTKLLPTVSKLMEEQYSELLLTQQFALKVLEEEEKKFRETLSNGLGILEKEIKNTQAVLSGGIAFKLYDTYGFPLDLTQDILKSKGLKVDEVGFNKAMQKQKDNARKGDLGIGAGVQDKIWFDIFENLGETEFIGFNNISAGSVVLGGIVNYQGEFVKEITGDSEGFALIFPKTPFYGEAGGQVGDSGFVTSAGGGNLLAKVVDTQKMVDGKLIVHYCKPISKELKLKVGELYGLIIDSTRRAAIKANHSATHLLHAALKSVLDANYVQQKGSVVRDDALRFDFSWHRAMTLAEIKQVEIMVNEHIVANTEVITALMNKDEAIKAGAQALFGEKYQDKVRVLNMGKDSFSVELCGGTHVNRTGDIGAFIITYEASIASGVRRLEAVTGLKAIELMQGNREYLQDISEVLNTKPEHLVDKVKAIKQENKKLKDQPKVQLAKHKEVDINGVKVVYLLAEGDGAKQLRGKVDQLRADATNAFVVCSNYDGKKSTTIIGSNDPSINALEVAAKIAVVTGGKGHGGRKDFAQTGGVDKLEEKLLFRVIEDSLD